MHVARQRPKYVRYRARFSCFLRPSRSESANDADHECECESKSTIVSYFLFCHFLQHLLIHRLSFLWCPSAHLMHMSGPSPVQPLQALSQAGKVNFFSFRRFYTRDSRNIGISTESIYRWLKCTTTLYVHSRPVLS